mmetsp:Transcript_49376/g.89344  ORF Transcript_49376/g.89344 Transcript_49376/m.89344 type:complete len:219 (+) Transcript_49376:240-896(+)
MCRLCLNRANVCRDVQHNVMSKYCCCATLLDEEQGRSEVNVPTSGHEGLTCRQIINPGSLDKGLDLVLINHSDAQVGELATSIIVTLRRAEHSRHTSCIQAASCTCVANERVQLGFASRLICPARVDPRTLRGIFVAWPKIRKIPLCQVFACHLSTRAAPRKAGADGNNVCPSVAMHVALNEVPCIVIPALSPDVVIVNANHIPVSNTDVASKPNLHV